MTAVEGKCCDILVLDDDAFMLRLVARMLGRLGYQRVTTCEDGAQALTELTRQRADLILLDLNMPEMDGIEFIRHLVERHFRGAIILISGEQERTLQAAENLLHANGIAVPGYLVKPVRLAALEAVLERWQSAPGSGARPRTHEYPPQAVERALGTGQLCNYYQPKVSLVDGSLRGVEALVRWRHPQDGLVPPNQFIPVAESHGLIERLSLAVLEAALADIRAWRAEGLAVQVAINISMDNLKVLSFADTISQRVAASGANQQQLIFELTESRLSQDFARSLDIFTRLRLKGFKLSIDDFGTGHSSLVQLRDFPFDQLKIDHSFVHGLAHNPRSRAIFEACCQMAKQLQMDVVAEGVEDEQDLAFLRSSGCDAAQGYFIGRPMPAAELPAWLAEWERKRKALFG